MSEMKTVSAKITNISPLQTMQVDLEITNENGESEQVQTIYFINQTNGNVFDFNGPVDEKTQKGIHQWIQRVNEEAKRKFMGGLATATPEQLKEMGIDLNDRDALMNSGKKKIIL